MLASPLILAQNEATVYNLPQYFTWVFGLLLIAGGLGWLVATVLGFSRARAKPSTVATSHASPPAISSSPKTHVK